MHSPLNGLIKASIESLGMFSPMAVDASGSIRSTMLCLIAAGAYLNAHRM
jgi:hypothetical protein